MRLVGDALSSSIALSAENSVAGASAGTTVGGANSQSVRPVSPAITAEMVSRLAEEVYPHAERIRLVYDNLSTHTAAAFYATFPPERARRLARRVEFVRTPVHGSWLNMVEIELSVL